MGSHCSMGRVSALQDEVSDLVHDNVNILNTHDCTLKNGYGGKF